MADFVPYEYIVAAQLYEPTDDDYSEVSKAANSMYMIESARKPYGKNGKPRMLFLSAWMAHEGRNLNGDAFVKEELQERVKQGLFAPPYAGMIDDDHDFTARGFWYKTAFAYDAVAQKWGILAHGAIWAWRYEDLASRLSNEMTTNGNIKVSMSTMAESAEVRLDYPGYMGQRTKVLHNPVFFTTSTLSVPPGDDHAIGIATDNPDRTIVDPSGTNPEISISEAKMAKNDKITAQGGAPEPTGDEPKSARALNKLQFPKAFWKTADAVLSFATNEGLGPWSVSEDGDSYAIVMVDSSNFKAGTLVTSCIAGEASNCAIRAVEGELNVEGDIKAGKDVDQIQEAYKKHVAKLTKAAEDDKKKDLDGDNPDPTKGKKDEKPGDKKDDAEPDNDDDDKKGKANGAVPGTTKETKGLPAPMPEPEPSMIEPVKPVQHQDQTLGDGSTSNTSAPIKEEPVKTMNEYSLDEYKAKLAEAELIIKALNDEKVSLAAELEKAKKQLTDYESKKAEEEETARLASRLAKLPEVVKANLEKHPEKDAIKARWAKASDSEWEIVRSSFGLARLGIGLLELSEQEGRLPVGGGSATTVSINLQSYLK